MEDYKNDINEQRVLAESAFKTTQEMSAFFEEVIRAKLQGIINPSLKEQIVLHLYTRIYNRLLALTKLDHKLLFESAHSELRSMFEFSLDLVCIINDDSDQEVYKYVNYPNLTRYKFAKKISEYAIDNPDEAIGTFFTDSMKEKARNYVNEMETGEKVQIIKRKYWGRVKGIPKSWRNKDFVQFSRDMGKYDQYIRIYPVSNWFIHSGPNGFMSFDEDSMEILFYFCHIDAHEIFIDATETALEFLNVSSAIVNFKLIMSRFRNRVNEIAQLELEKLYEEKENS